MIFKEKTLNIILKKDKIYKVCKMILLLIKDIYKLINYIFETFMKVNASN
jgi:hypothetical protein